MKLTLTAEHVERALDVGKWKTNTCLLAQAGAEKFGVPVIACGYDEITFANQDRLRVLKAREFVEPFDRAMGSMGMPGDTEGVNYAKLQRVLDRLPVTLDAEWVTRRPWYIRLRDWFRVANASAPKGPG